MGTRKGVLHCTVAITPTPSPTFENTFTLFQSRDRLCPPQYHSSARIFKTSYGPVKVLHAFTKYLLVFNSILSKTCLNKISLSKAAFLCVVTFNLFNVFYIANTELKKAFLKSHFYSIYDSKKIYTMYFCPFFYFFS